MTNPAEPVLQGDLRSATAAGGGDVVLRGVRLARRRLHRRA
ncbi:MAG: hypothetical protein R2838_17010 [Caldilineaceae bacterium]